MLIIHPRNQQCPPDFYQFKRDTYTAQNSVPTHDSLLTDHKPVYSHTKAFSLCMTQDGYAI